jgi:Ankyrin repeats (many copies)
MPTVPLPNDPSFDQLRKQAKDLRDLARTGEPAALDLIAEHHPRGAHPVSLTGAQLVVARRYGFPSWAQLKRRLDVVAQYGRVPDEVTAAEPVDEFLRLACLRYAHDDGPANWEQARRLLVEHPSMPWLSIHAAAAVAAADAVASFVTADSSLACAEGGPFRWEPLLYLAYARHQPDVTEEAVVTTARLLLEHGADPNAGYLWHGTNPFTALTGTFGGGELGPANQPPHPHAHALALVLLDAGADPNDSQALYNRMFTDDDEHLRLLLAHGLGRGDAGSWHRRLATTTDPDQTSGPAELLRNQLLWAIVHDQRARVRLLVDHDVDIRTPFSQPHDSSPWTDGRAPAEVALLNGNVDIAEELISRGATRPVLVGVDALVGALLADDRPAAYRLRAFADEARTRRPGLVVWATAQGRTDVVRLLVEFGFDVNTLGRSDVPVEQPWESALHHAAGNGDVAMTRLLLSLGADPSLQDCRFGATPLGWAQHFNQPATIALLAPT